ncbi:hypothetical protein ISS22_15395 [candidate division KSB1 bacterium]|nr:hypothetical protein [candidate division KSB1 bacterium]
MPITNTKFSTRLIVFILGVVSFCSLTNLIAESSSPPGVIHFPVRSSRQGQSIYLEAKVEEKPMQQVQYVRIYFRTKGLTNFRYVEMDEQLDNYSGDIPASAVTTPGIEYFILALFTDRSMATSPPSNPYYNPHEISVTPASDTPVDAAPAESQKQLTSASGADLQTIILSPEPGESVAKDDVVIAVSFLGETEKIDIKTIKLLLDGKNYTSAAEISENMLTYVPQSLTRGSHRVKIEITDLQGNRFQDLDWRFSIVSERAAERIARKKLPFSGNVYAEFRNEKFADSTYSVTNLGGRINGKFGPLKYNGRVFITSREDPKFQPRNRMFFEVGTSWIGAKFGDCNPTFNDLMLWGRRVRGFEAYIKLGFINVEFVTGKTNRKMEGIPYTLDPANPVPPNYIHPVTGQSVTSMTGIYRTGTYDQTLMAIRPSFGSGKNFQFGLNLVKVKDDAESIENGTKPKDNIVIGPDFLLAFDNHRIEIKASAAFSLLADDISTGAISTEDFESMGMDVPLNPADYEDYFVINTSLVPLDPTGLTSLAYQGSFKFNYFNNFINVVYKSIGSAYQALANNYVRKDIKGFSFYDRIRMYRNQVYLNVGLEKYLEEISTEDDGEDATAPNDYKALSIGVSLFPQARYWPRLNVNWKSYDRNNGLDTLITLSAVKYQNSDISLQLGYDITLFGLDHTFNISHITNDRADGFNRTHANFANSIQMYSLKTDYQIPLTTTISYAMNNNDAGGSYDFKYNMFGVSGKYRMLNNNLTLSAGFASTSAVGNTNTSPEPYTDYKRTAFNFGGNYRFLIKHSIILDMSIINFTDDAIDKTYDNSFLRIRYQVRY